MDKRIVFTKINKAELLDVPFLEMPDHCIKVKTAFSTISQGTERANITGDPNVTYESEPNGEVVFPRYSGYSSSGIVVEKGKNVKDFEIGDRVAMSWSAHRGYNVLPAQRLIKLESDNVSLEEASIFHIATFPLAAIRKTRLEIGESLMVMGLGILGLLAVQLARAAGAVPVIAVDPIKEKREKALAIGADYALDPFEAGFAEKVKKITKGGVNAAIEVTGQGAGLNEALDCMARFGRVALLGCTRNFDFTVDYYRKVHAPGITLIGAHTLARPERESHPGWFTTKDDMQSVLKLCEAGRLNLKDIIEETHSPLECEAVYERLINDKNFPTVVQFDWSDIK